MFAIICSLKLEVCKKIIEENQEQASAYKKRLDDLTRIYYRAKHNLPISLDDKKLVKNFPVI